MPSDRVIQQLRSGDRAQRQASSDSWTVSSGLLCSISLDEFVYVQKDQAESSVLFDLISARYEWHSPFITTRQPIGGWHMVFPDGTTADHFVLHATILTLDAETQRK